MWQTEPSPHRGEGDKEEKGGGRERDKEKGGTDGKRWVGGGTRRREGETGKRWGPPLPKTQDVCASLYIETMHHFPLPMKIFFKKSYPRDR